MKVIFIDNPIQDANTEQPQLIDGDLYYWKVRSRQLYGGTLKEFIDLVVKLYDDELKYLLIYDAIPCDKYYCDQGCKAGEGCKKEYKEDNHSMMLRYYKIMDKIEPIVK